MSLIELFIVAVGLSMDAFAVAVCKGLAAGRIKPSHSLIVGLYFGGFQALMPLVGYMLGSRFSHAIENYDHWIAFILLAVIGFNMVKESFSREEECPDPSLEPKNMILLAIATSIDALAAGVTFAFLKVSIIPAILFIGCVTLALSASGVYAGSIFGSRWKSGAELSGGLILILMGLKILLEHMGVLQ